LEKVKDGNEGGKINEAERILDASSERVLDASSTKNKTVGTRKGKAANRCQSIQCGFGVIPVKNPIKI